MPTINIEAINAGLINYASAEAHQDKLHERCQTTGDGAILLLEHPPTITFGKNASSINMLSSKDRLKNLGIEVHYTDRGGEVTAHEPGQLVVYPILPITQLNLTPKRYVCLLEQTIIDSLADIGISATRHSVNPGIWVENKKICAVGIRIKNRITKHGIALNISNSLNTFNHIVPCGLKNFFVTSIEEELKQKTDFETIKNSVLDKLTTHLQNQLKSDGNRLNFTRNGFQTGQHMASL